MTDVEIVMGPRKIHRNKSYQSLGKDPSNIDPSNCDPISGGSDIQNVKKPEEPKFKMESEYFLDVFNRAKDICDGVTDKDELNWE